MKKIRYLLTIIMLLIGISPVFAATNNIVDFSKKGNITITLSTGESNDVVKNAEIKIYKLAAAYSENSNLSFSYHEQINEYKDSIKNNDLNEEILNCIYNSDIIARKGTTNDLGYISFDNLDLGLYLIEQTNKVEGYSKIEPFLIYLPQFEENKWVYEVDATPKVDITKLFDLTVEKIWNVTSGTDIPSEITIDLYKDEVVIDTITLSEENNWSYTWNQIEQSDKYHIKEKNVPEGYTDTYRQEENKLIVTNTKTLVQTGQNIWVSIILTTFGLISIMIGYIYSKNESN